MGGGSHLVVVVVGGGGSRFKKIEQNLLKSYIVLNFISVCIIVVILTKKSSKNLELKSFGNILIRFGLLCHVSEVNILYAFIIMV